MKKHTTVRRKLSTKASRKYWASIERLQREVNKLPRWMRQSVLGYRHASAS